MVSLKNKPKKTLLDSDTYEYIVSACLAGFNCTYKEANHLKPAVRQLVRTGKAIPVCPEVLGRLGIPRENSEILQGSGREVIDGASRIVTASGVDVTEYYISGSKKALAVAKRHHISKAILKSKSPACGYGYIYNGKFQKRLKRGIGVFAALLISNRIKIYNERGKF